MPAPDQDDRILIARIASAERWGRVRDRTTATEPARAGLRAKFEREADPDGTLAPAEVASRADHLMRAHMLRMSRAAARARRRGGASTKLRTRTEKTVPGTAGTGNPVPEVVVTVNTVPATPVTVCVDSETDTGHRRVVGGGA